MINDLKNELRLYCFNQFYLSGIRNGIQALHSSQWLRNKYDPSTDIDKWKVVYEWATKHETVVVLNGGDCQNMGKLRGLLESPKNPYPYAAFKEPGMSNLLTSMCVVLPEKIFDLGNKEFILKHYQFDKDENKFITTARSLLIFSDWEKLSSYTEWEKIFIVEMSKCPLAN